MAEENENQKTEAKKEKKAEKKGGLGKILPWIIMFVIMIVSAGAGLGLGKLLAGMKKPAEEQKEQTQDQTETVDLSSDSQQKNWYYSIGPIIANLNEPSATRFIRVTLKIEISSQIDQNKGTALFIEKEPVITNWLIIYFAGLTIEDLRGDKNLRIIQSQILDAFNEELFPNSKPGIKSILFEECAVQ